MVNTLEGTPFCDMTPRGPDFYHKKYIYTLVETSFNKDTRDMELVFVKRSAKDASDATLVKSHIVLTGIVLEYLGSNKNKLYAFYSKYIVAATDYPQIYPSWYIKMVAKTQRENFLARATEEASAQRQKLLSEEEEIKREIKDVKQNKTKKAISSRHAELWAKKNEISQTEKEISELSDKIQTISNNNDDDKENTISSLYEHIHMLTESVYRLENECDTISNGRNHDKALLHQLKKRKKEIPQELSDINHGLRKKQGEIYNWYMSELSRANEKRVIVRQYIDAPKSSSDKQKSSKKVPAQNQTQFYVWGKTTTNVHTEEYAYNTAHFYPLRYVMNNKFREMMGCYVIRNTENGKCYVGQSIHMMKRLKQHFNGTKPRNYIFCDDYYSSSNRENLFEVAFYGCNSPSELDAQERDLIRFYNANKTGYNSTSGNK